MGGKYMWIHLQENVGAHTWAAVARNGSHQTRIDYEPEMKNMKNSICERSACVFFHRKTKFIFELRSRKDSTHLGAHISYVPKNGSDAKDFVKYWNAKHSRGNFKLMHNCNAQEGWYRDPDDGEQCRQYAWVFDQCVIKMNFTNQNRDKILKKHLIMKSDLSSSEGDTVASFDDPMFISKEELKSNLNYDTDSAKGRGFLPVVIEISTRIYLAGWTVNGERVSEDDKDLLFTRPSSQNLIASNKRMKVTSFAQSYLNTLRPGDGNCNLVLAIGPDRKDSISVHKALLAVKSPVFYTMYGGGWQDSNSGILKMEDTNLAEATAFVNFLYDHNANFGSLDEYDWDLKVCLGVLKLAHLYQVMDLVEFCVDNMIVAPDSDLCLTTALEIFKSGELFDVHYLSTRALLWIKSNKKTFSSEDKKKLKNFIASVDDKEKIMSSIK